jgi:hypothetical protein
MGPGQPYYDAQPVGTFLNTQWNTIKDDLIAGNQVYVGGFIFDWCDEYCNNNEQVGGPNAKFQGGKFAGGYWHEAGFGVASAVDQSTYGQGKPNISRTFFKAYDALKTARWSQPITARFWSMAASPGESPKPPGEISPKLPEYENTHSAGSNPSRDGTCLPNLRGDGEGE